MPGIEYAFGALLLKEGFVSEAERVVSAVRERYDGEKRNPWSEIECGHNYARSMASYSLLLLYSGFSFDMTKKHVGFAPIKKGDGNYFWSVGNSFGTVRYEGGVQTLSVMENELALSSFGLRDATRVTVVTVDGVEIPFEQKENTLSFAEQTVRSELKIKTAAV
jgi:hypothetical protein